MGKKFKFDHTNKWYRLNPVHVLENGTHKLLWDFDIHTDHLISARRPDLLIINKKKENLQKHILKFYVGKISQCIIHLIRVKEKKNNCPLFVILSEISLNHPNAQNFFFIIFKTFQKYCLIKLYQVDEVSCIYCKIVAAKFSKCKIDKVALNILFLVTQEMLYTINKWIYCKQMNI